jgi:hypothetical protein
MLQQTNNARHMAKSVHSGISTTLMIVCDDGSSQPRGFLLSATVEPLQVTIRRASKRSEIGSIIDEALAVRK